MDDVAPPTVHPAADEAALAELVAELTAPERQRDGVGWHVVVQVLDGGSTVYARLADPAQLGDGSQRWLRHAPRGASTGGWTEAHHPRSEAELGAWRAERADALDRQLIQLSKQAWKCDASAPYAVEFAPRPLA
jgi:hypothetical protein